MTKEGTLGLSADLGLPAIVLALMVSLLGDSFDGSFAYFLGN
jgi:hypothetical protein